MKKAEVRNEIKEIIYERIGIRPDTADIAQAILNKLEDLGMKPPTIVNPELPKGMTLQQHADEMAQDRLYNRKPKYPSEYYVNDWELED